jgi:hypothetical protein
MFILEMVNIVVKLDGFNLRVGNENPKIRPLKIKPRQKPGESFKKHKLKNLY